MQKLIGDFHRFCDENGFWLEDYSLYRGDAVARSCSVDRMGRCIKTPRTELLATAKKRVG